MVDKDSKTRCKARNCKPYKGILPLCNSEASNNACTHSRDRSCSNPIFLKVIHLEQETKHVLKVTLSPQMRALDATRQFCNVGLG